MKNHEAQALIAAIQKDLTKTIPVDKVVANLELLRPFAIEEEDPTLTKVIRLTFQHLQKHKSFNIPVPEEIEVLDEIEEGAEEPVVEKAFEVKALKAAEQLESLNYLVALMKDARKPMNREDLIEYRNMLMAYEEAVSK